MILNVWNFAMINTSYSHFSHSQSSTVKPSQAVKDVTAPKNIQSPQNPAKATRFDLSDYPAAYKALSREQLAEIRLNRNGLYTEDEQGTAGWFLYVPISMSTKKSVELGLSQRDLYKADIDVMDEAGPLERQTFEWAYHRASLVQGYEASSASEGKQAENLDVENPLYRMLKDFFDNYHNKMMETGIVTNLLSEPEYLRIKEDYLAENAPRLSLRV